MNSASSPWLEPIGADSHILLRRESPLRRIPVNVTPKQALFFDGIRHAVEVMDVAFKRLRDALTRLALNDPTSEDLPLICAGVFLDAWAMVDAIDRFRMLYSTTPGMSFGPPRDGVQPLREVLQVFRDLRNIGDHLSQRADRVLSQGGGALGELTWLTGASLSPKVIAWHCTLRPGTLRSKPALPSQPIESTLDWPTDFICISAGGFQGNLSAVRTAIAARVRHLEVQLENILSEVRFASVAVINDYFGRRAVEPRELPGDERPLDKGVGD